LGRPYGGEKSVAGDFLAPGVVEHGGVEVGIVPDGFAKAATVTGTGDGIDLESGSRLDDTTQAAGLAAFFGNEAPAGEIDRGAGGVLNNDVFVVFVYANDRQFAGGSECLGGVGGRGRGG